MFVCVFLCVCMRLCLSVSVCVCVRVCLLVLIDVHEDLRMNQPLRSIVFPVQTKYAAEGGAPAHFYGKQISQLTAYNHKVQNPLTHHVSVLKTDARPRHRLPHLAIQHRFIYLYLYM